MPIDASKIRLIVLDVDGTLTDGGIYVLESGVQRAVQQGHVITIISRSKASGMVLNGPR